MKTIILKIETESIEKTLQMIVPIMGCDVYEMANPRQRDVVDRRCDWKHLRKKGK